MMPTKRKQSSGEFVLSKVEQTLCDRFLVLQDFDVWFPLVVNREWIAEHPQVPSLPLVLGVSAERLQEIMTPGRLWPAPGVSWKIYIRAYWIQDLVRE